MALNAKGLNFDHASGYTSVRFGKTMMVFANINEFQDKDVKSIATDDLTKYLKIASEGFLAVKDDDSKFSQTSQVVCQNQYDFEIE